MDKIKSAAVDAVVWTAVTLLALNVADIAVEALDALQVWLVGHE